MLKKLKLECLIEGDLMFWPMFYKNHTKEYLMNLLEKLTASSEEGAGDVKYHLGASSNREFDGNSVHVSLTDNPSHLEAVNPVVLRSN